MKMINLRSILPAVALAALLFNTSARADSWGTDYAKAVKQANTENKAVLLDFTGSDWCPWCIRMDKEALSQKQFTDFADGKLVLVKVDFPQNSPQPDAVKQQNEDLKTKYSVEGFPSFILLKDSKVVWRQEGYLAGGASAFVSAIQAHLK